MEGRGSADRHQGKEVKKKTSEACPCGGKSLASCCGPYIAGTPAPTAAHLMRSRYTAYVLGDEPYLLATWHVSRRPLLPVVEPDLKWLGLEVRKHAVDAHDPARATVEFVARFKVGGRGQRLHEISNFIRETEPDGQRWYYVDGIFPEERQ
jgi:SEC-C motif-containing protein